MPRYSDPHDPHDAAHIYGGVPGNYVLFDRHGRAYAGKQGDGVNRIADHLRKHPGQFVQAHFMIDHSNDDCRRTAREEKVLTNLLDNGVPVRNQRWPAKPKGCKC